MSDNKKIDDEEIERGKETSILFEPLSVWIIVLCLLASIWFTFFPLLIVSTFLLLLSLFILIWKKYSLKNVKPTLSVPKARMFAGDNFIVHASIKNDKWLPLIWLEWEFPTSRFIRWGTEQSENYIARFLWLLWYQKVDWTIHGYASQRGVYEIGNFLLRSGDGFRFTEKVVICELHERMYIYPKIVSVHVPSFSTSMQWEITGKKGGFLEDPLLINGVRDYEAGDEWRRINGKASARLGKLQTNVYEPIISRQIILYVDVFEFVIDEERFPNEPLKQEKYEKIKKERFEHVLETVASVALEYDKRGIKVGFATNGLNYVGDKAALVFPHANVTKLLDEIAKLIQKVSDFRMTRLDELLGQGIRTCPVFIFTERLKHEHILWYERNGKNYDVHYYYLVENEHVRTIQNVAKRIDRLRYEAVVNEG